MASTPLGLYNASSCNVVHYLAKAVETGIVTPGSKDEGLYPASGKIAGDSASLQPADGTARTAGDVGRPDDGIDAISIVQRGNLKALERTLRKQWRMGQNIVLCWSSDERGLLVIFVPHYFLGNYCAAGDTPTQQSRDNETFIRDLISGERRKTREELFAVCERLDIPPTFIRLKTALSEEAAVLDAVEQVIKRYGLSYVESRAVLLFDIVDFSLFTPFEQASQLNSLSYSLNSAYNKLLDQGIEINFARTTTGDGYYIWNRDLSSRANQDLFLFMLLVVADNAVAQEASRGNTVPVIRTGYHIGGHYELYQAEGVNPSVFSYIVGDVTIELARMLDIAKPNQVLIGDFHCEQAGWESDTVKSITAVSASSFVNACDRALPAMHGVALAGGTVEGMRCHLTESIERDGQSRPRRLLIIDKHGLERYAYNLHIDIDLAGEGRALGLSEEQFAYPSRSRGEGGAGKDIDDTPPDAEAAFKDLANLLEKRCTKVIIEDYDDGTD